MESVNKAKTKSLKTVAMRIILAVMVVLLIVTTSVSFWLYIYSYLRSYKHELDMLSSYVFSNIDRSYLEELFDETEKIYDSLPEDIRKDPFTDEFKDNFTSLIDERYKNARGELVRCRETTGNMTGW